MPRITATKLFKIDCTRFKDEYPFLSGVFEPGNSYDVPQEIADKASANGWTTASAPPPPSESHTLEIQE